MRKILAVLLTAFICLCVFSACSKDGSSDVENTDVVIEDIEDAGVGVGSVTLANLMGKDAVELLARSSGTTEWSKNILSQDTLRANVAVEMKYTKTETNKFDVRLVFEDGTSQEFTNLDFAAAKSTIYLGIK